MEIFISYSSKDIDLVKRCCRKFREENLEYWVAHENAEFGGQYAATIIEEIDKCEAFVVFISDASNLSTHVINEINSAVMRNKLIVPIMVSDVKLSPAMEYYISSNHYIKAYDNDNFMTMLVKRVSEILGRNDVDGSDVFAQVGGAVDNVMMLAEQGDAEALCEMGRRFYAGSHGLEKNLIRAFHYFRKSAEQNHPAAICNLGWCYESGEGTTQDWQKAFDCYLKSAELGCSMGQYSLGWMYDNGVFVKMNKSTAMAWFIKSAENGQSMAQYKVGMAYMDGICVDKDYVIANHWLMLAADKGVVFAQYQLAENYYFGRGCQKDIIKAKQMWLLASSRGYDRADYALEKYYDIYYANENKSFIV